MAGTVGPLRRGARAATDPDAKKPFSWTTLGVAATIVVVAHYTWRWLVLGQPVGSAFLVGPLLLLLSTPLMIRAGRRTAEFDLGGLLYLGLVLRFGAAYFRLANGVDSESYHVQGARLALAYRHLDFGAPITRPIPGTGGLDAIAGVVHVLTFGDNMGAFLVMSWLSFIGCWFLYRAFEVSVGDGDRYRYALLLMLWPTMIYWPSSLGKDAWMVFTIGMAALGTARIFRRMAGGYTLFVLGLVGASTVRPHLSLLALLAFVVAFLVGRRHTTRNSITPGFLAKLIGLALVIVLGSVLVARTQSVLDIQDFSSSSLQTATNQVESRTGVGGSAFHPANPRSPTGFPVAAVTVLFRPFPFEAHGFEQLFTSAEGLVLAVLTLTGLRRLWSIPRRIRSQPYVTLCLVYVLLWILAFGIIANFGILARQRTQMLPFYFVLLSVPAVVAKPQTAVADTTERPLT